MDDLIDFSDRDDEYLDGELRQRVLAFAIITSIVGFVISSWLFVGRKIGPASLLLDRRAAEGMVVTDLSRSVDSRDDSYSAFRAPRVAMEPSSKSDRKPPWLGLNVVASSEEKSVEKQDSTKAKKRVIQTSVGLVPEYIRKDKSSPSRPPPKLTTPKTTVALHRLLFPLVEERPPRGSLAEVERALRGNVFLMANLQGEYEVGVAIDASGRAFVSSALANSEYLDRIWVNGSLRQAKVLGRDAEMGVALIQLEGDGFRDIPLSPVPPAVGERVLTFRSHGRSASPRDCRVGPTFGAAAYFLDGDLGRGVTGAPILNDRGELAGYYVHSLPGAPGGGIHLVADTAVLYRLMRGYQGGGGYLGGLESEARSHLSSSLQALAGQTEVRRGRVLAGLSLSDLHLGMTQSEAGKWLSSPEKFVLGNGFELWRSPAPPVSVYFVDGRAAMIATEHNGFATPQGLSPGAQADIGKLSAHYPGLELYPQRASAPGLDILLEHGKRVAGFVVKPDLSKL